MFKKMNFTYNYTLFGTNEYESYFPINPNLIPLYLKVSHMEQIFNSFGHEKLVFMYWSLINPSYNKLVSFLGNEIEHKCSYQKSYNIVAFGIMLGYILFLVFVIWFPFVNCLSANVSLIFIYFDCFYCRYIKQKICYQLFQLKSLLLWKVFREYLI